MNNCCDFEIKIERRWHLLEEIRYFHKRSYFYTAEIVESITATFHPKPITLKAFPSHGRMPNENYR